VIRALAAHGIKPDVIVGTSIGAVVGACYAGGRLDTFEDWSRSLTRRGILSYLDVSLSGAGLIRGGKLAIRLEETFGDMLIEQLPIRFATISTEVGTGHEIWLTRGRLVEALRASYALPGIFPPIRLGGRWLVDGALVNPVPVSAARALGARLVIAVNLNGDVLGRGATIASHGSDESDELFREQMARQSGLRAIFGPERALKRQFLGNAERPGIPMVMADAFNIMQDRITRARLAGDPPDVTIAPRLGHIGWFDFHRARESTEIGARAAQRSLDLVDEAIVALSPQSSSR
jgi:NTE family protein